MPENADKILEWSQRLINFIHEHDREMLELERKINECDKNLEIFKAEIKTEMRLKSGLWGAIAGMLPLLIGLLIWLIKEVVK